MDAKLKAILDKDPELKKAYESDIEEATANGERAAAVVAPKTKEELLKSKAPAKPKCFKKYPKKGDTAKLSELGCRGCFWAQVCKGSKKEIEHLESVLS